MVAVDAPIMVVVWWLSSERNHAIVVKTCENGWKVVVDGG